MRSFESGQASTEYVGVLALIAVVGALAATAVAAPDLPGVVVHHFRLALCIVGGDVCRDRDARAQGLEPCARTFEAHTRDDSLSFGVGEFERGEWSVTRRSDGTWVLTALRGHGGELGAGVSAATPGPAAADLSGAVRLTWMSGSEWELPEARIRDLVRRMHGHVDGLAQDFSAGWHGLPEPKYRYTEGGLTTDLAASVTLGSDDGGTALDLGGADGGLVLGRRRGAGGDVWYFRATSALQVAAADLGLPAQALVGEYHAGPPATLVLRSTSTSGDRQTERLVTLALRSADARATAARALLGGDAAAVARRLREEAVIERRTYRVRSDDGGVDLKLLGFGYEHRTTAEHRTLVGADVLVGGRKVQRADCLGTV